MQGAELIYREVRDRQNAPEADKTAARAKMEGVRAAVIQRMVADVQSARRLGLSQVEALMALQAAHLGEAESALLLAGVGTPYIDRPFNRARLMGELLEKR
jgi:regulator of protease activity HflC (stomatin/prohibitin superfamily)